MNSRDKSLSVSRNFLSHLASLSMAISLIPYTLLHYFAPAVADSLLNKSGQLVGIDIPAVTVIFFHYYQFLFIIPVISVVACIFLFRTSSTRTCKLLLSFTTANLLIASFAVFLAFLASAVPLLPLCPRLGYIPFVSSCMVSP